MLTTCQLLTDNHRVSLQTSIVVMDKRQAPLGTDSPTKADPTTNMPPPKVQGHPDICADHLLALFRSQNLEASGEAFLKLPGFHLAKKYYAELRGSTMILFRNASVAISSGTLMRDIIAVLVIQYYHVDVEKKQGQSARIHVGGPGLNGSTLYVKPGELQLNTWLQALAIADSISLPCLDTMTVDSVIGQGGGGKVFLVRDNETLESYALKVIGKKQALSSPNALKHVVSERNLMAIIGFHPFILPMKFAFQSEVNLFIGTPFCGGGDFATYLKNQWKKHGSSSPELPLPNNEKRKYGGHLTEAVAIPIIAEMVLALEHLHSKGVVYRDLKPENIMISDDGHIRLGDFGLAKNLSPSRMGQGFVRTTSICGTRNYLPPEMLFGRLYSLECDIWSLGILVFRTLVGRFPFEASRTKEVFSKVKREKICYPDFLSSDAVSFMEGLLDRDQEKRKTVLWAKNHNFLASVNWKSVMESRGGPVIPHVQLQDSIDVLENFDVSKIQDVSMGEEGHKIDIDSSSLTMEQLQLRVNPERRILGFEYAEHDVEIPPPLAVKKVNSNLMTEFLGVFKKTSSDTTDEDGLTSRKSLDGLQNRRTTEDISKLKSGEGGNGDHRVNLVPKRSSPDMAGPKSPKDIFPDR